ncbi:MAG: FG-GAP repeat protein, partial [Salinirussus sp.]
RANRRDGRMQAKLTVDTGDQGDILGSAVAVEGNTAVVTAAGEATPNGGNGGAAYVFTRSGTT